MKPNTLQVPRARTAADMASAIAAAARERARLAEEAARTLPKGEAWVMGCNSNYKHVGIIFADGVDPRSATAIHGGMWFSATHDLSEPYFGTRDGIVCSQCLSEGGMQNPLRVEEVPGPREMGFQFMVPTRWHRYLNKINVEHLAPYMPQVAEKVDDLPPDLPYTPPVEEPKVVIPDAGAHEKFEALPKVAGSAKEAKS